MCDDIVRRGGKEARIRETLRDALWTVVFFRRFLDGAERWRARYLLTSAIFMSRRRRSWRWPRPSSARMRSHSCCCRSTSSRRIISRPSYSPKGGRLSCRSRADSSYSGALILMLPLLAGADSLWFAMPITELVTAVYAAACIRRYTARLDAKSRLTKARPPPYNHGGNFNEQEPKCNHAA